MIRIQSSYKVIKKDYVSLANDDTSLIDTKVDYDIQVYHDKDQEKKSVKETRKKSDIRESIKEDLLEELKEERENIINQAMKEAVKLKLDAKNNGYKEGFDKGLEDGLKQGLDEGNTRGLEEGYRQAIEEAQDEANEIKRSAINLLEDSEKEVDLYIEENRQRIIDLAAEMAESIVHSTIDSSSENIVQLIKPIVQQFKKVENIIITCNPKNYDYLKKSIYGIEKKYENIKFIVLEDESLEKNGCIVENEDQIIDLQIKKQLENIVEKLDNLE